MNLDEIRGRLCAVPSNKLGTRQVAAVKADRVDIRRPGRNEFVRVVPDASLYGVDTIKMQDDGRFYPVSATIAPYAEEATEPYDLHLVLNRLGGVFILPTRQADLDSHAAVTSMAEAVAAAQGSWTKIAWDKAARAFVAKTSSIFPEPTWPSEEEIGRYWELALQHSEIRELNNPVLVRALGVRLEPVAAQ